MTTTTTRGRRATAAHLGLLDRSPSGRRRGKLPSDRRLLGALGRRMLRVVYRVVGALVLVSVLSVVAYRFINPPVTPLMLIRPIEGLGEGRGVGISKDWISIDEVDRDLLRSLIAAEDARFAEHSGIDWKAIESAKKANDRSDGEKLRGGSTITMQCAKNVFLWQGRNYLRKALEAYFTYLIELLWGKERILEVYLNVIEWGDGIYGAEAAAQEYFGISAARLTPRQAALLAAVLPNPRRFSAAKPSNYIKRRASRILAGARSVGLAWMHEEARGEPRTAGRE